jgi:hypothetical protein
MKADYAMFDIKKVKGVTMGVTIPLSTPYTNLKLEVEATDPETCRLALIETLAMVIPISSEPDRLLVNRYLKNILSRAIDE